MERIRQVGVVGAGVMGAGIAELFSSKGYTVVLVDVSDDVLEKALARISRHDEKLLESISTSTELSSLREVDLIVETVVEDLEVKQEVFRHLDTLNERAILASNTSTIQIALLAEHCTRKSRVVGMHFYNPPMKNQIMEIVKTPDTSQQTYDTTMEVARALGKTPIEVQDAYGFVGNRILMPLINEAAWALSEGVSTKEGIDTVFTLGMLHPMGPLALADFIGLDTCVHIMNLLHKGLGEERFKPCPLLLELVENGKLGRKSGRGFYEYKKKP